MANLDISNIDNASVALRTDLTQDETLAFAGADTFVKGTLLARRHVATAITPSAITGTGNGTVTAATVTASPYVPKAGNWTLLCVAAATHGGTWALKDPDGATVATLVMTAGAGVATAFEAAGLAFTITDGATDFAVGDTFTLPVTADGKLVPYNPAGAGGAQYPVAVLLYEVTKAGAGNLLVNVMTKGRVNRDRLVIDVDGDGDNITAAILDQLRAAGIEAQSVSQLGAYDTQD